MRSVRHDATTNIFRMDQTPSQCLPMLLWTEVEPVHTPVRRKVYGLALSQSNFSILSAFFLVYNNSIYCRNICSIGGWFAVKTPNLNFVCCIVWRESSSVMDKLKEIENAISDNDFKKIDELKDCLQDRETTQVN